MWDHRQFYTLSEVYWRTGHAFYATAWTGFESSYAPVAGITERRRQLEKAKHDLVSYCRQEKYLVMNYPEGASNDQHLAHQNEIKATQAKVSSTRLLRDQLSRSLRSQDQDQETYERGENVERRLARAFSFEELYLSYGNQQRIVWDKWALHPSFKVSFADSLIYAPRELSSHRRASGFVLREEFDSWLSTTLETEIKLSKREGAEQFMSMRNWFLDCIEANKERLLKPDVEQQFLSQFAPNGKTTFAVLWQSFAPTHWKEKGRRQAESS